jgi:anthranilate phosphoribosyltransferase
MSGHGAQPASAPAAAALTPRELLERLLDRTDLAESEAAGLLLRLTDAELAPSLAGALLAALRAKGVTAAELRGLARTMRSLARRPQIPAGSATIDIVGTGGDSSGSFNLSTGAALLVAACGVRVVKHGNRSVSSRAGSADVLERLGLKLPLDEADAGDCLRAAGFTFLFAPYYHPAMKALAPVRAALGVRTVFNILGPLTNPSAPPYHLLGAFSVETAQLMAETLAGMEGRRAFVIHGAGGWDEPSPIGPFTLFDVQDGRVQRSVRTPEDYGIARCRAEDLAGGDAEHNAQALRAVLRGAQRGAHADALALGAALALEVMGEVRSPREGVARARAAIESGAAGGVLERLREFSDARARTEQ